MRSESTDDDHALGDGYCTTIDSEQRGAVYDDGDYDWKSSVKDTGNLPEAC